jgi:glutaconate CoA-transferase subunit B
VEKVDFKSGVGHGKERKEGIVKWGAPIEIISNLCVVDFEEETGRARLKSIHTGITLGQVKENTGFELIIPESISETGAPTDEELHILRNIIDPVGVRRLDFARGEEYEQVLAEIMSGGKH